MSTEDLIPIKKGETRRPRMGGLVKSPRKTRANQLKTFAYSKCKNCRVTGCPYKKYNLEQDKNHLCTCVEAKQKAVELNMPIMNGEVLSKLSFEVISKMQELASDTKDLQIIHNMLLNHKKEFFPNVTKNLNVNVDTKDLATEILDEMFDDEK